ncbi:MAG: three-Cys-motif partner protein TcmP [Actinomycetota bacterium]
MGEFFSERRPAAVLKHGILRRYLRVFASKTGSTSAGNRVAFLDGYSGPGEYEDGTPGSPMLAAETARILANVRNLEGYYVERDRDTFDHLCRVLATSGHTHRPFHGGVEEHLPEIMEGVADSPLFAFFDPFGLPVPLEALGQVGKDGNRARTAATELLVNFTLPGLRRNAGHLTSTSSDPVYLKARSSILDRLDATLGGGWWRDIWKEGSEDRETRIVLGYVKRLKAAGGGGWGHVVVPVENRWDGPPVYCLIFLSRYPGALWYFSEILSTSTEEFRAYSHSFHGMLDLDPLTDREARWIAAIEQNIRARLAEGAFVIGNQIVSVFGDNFGFARSTHARAAIKNLCEQGVIRTEVYVKGKLMTEGKGDVQGMTILPAD